MSAPSPRRIGGLGALALAGLYLAHQDFWNWHSSARVLGLPAGMAYHIAYCVAASVLLAWVSRGLGAGRR